MLKIKCLNSENRDKKGVGSRVTRTSPLSKRVNIFKGVRFDVALCLPDLRRAVVSNDSTRTHFIGTVQIPVGKTQPKPSTGIRPLMLSNALS